ncbi:MAG: hypothetical protein ACYC1Z_03435 [Georgenia sp.]
MRDLITTVLDLLGMLLVVAGAAVWVGQWSTAGALTVAGGGLLLSSWVADRWQSWMARRKRGQR